MIEPLEPEGSSLRESARHTHPSAHRGRRPDGGENVIASAKTGNDLPFSIPENAVPVESILCTEELRRRPCRPPDYEKENRALVRLAGALADSPSTILQTLVETIL